VEVQVKGENGTWPHGVVHGVISYSKVMVKVVGRAVVKDFATLDIRLLVTASSTAANQEPGTVATLQLQHPVRLTVVTAEIRHNSCNLSPYGRVQLAHGVDQLLVITVTYSSLWFVSRERIQMHQPCPCQKSCPFPGSLARG